MIPNFARISKIANLRDEFSEFGKILFRALEAFLVHDLSTRPNGAELIRLNLDIPITSGELMHSCECVDRPTEVTYSQNRPNGSVNRISYSNNGHIYVYIYIYI